MKNAIFKIKKKILSQFCKTTQKGYSREKAVTNINPIINSQIHEVIPFIQSQSLIFVVLQ